MIVTPVHEAAQDAAFWRSETARLLKNDPIHTTFSPVTHIFSGMPSETLIALSQNTTVKQVHFQLMSIVDGDLERLSEFGFGHSLSSLHLARNRITSAGLPALCTAALDHGSLLTSLNLSSNPLGADLGPLGRAVGQSTSLRSLNLSETQKNGEGLLAFAQALNSVAEDPTEHTTEPNVEATPRRSCPLEVLHLQGNGIDDTVAAGLVAPLAAAGVRELFMGKNAIGDAGVSAMASALAAVDAHGVYTSPLRRLSLMANAVGGAGACALAASLGPLQHLNLGHNRLDDDGVRALTASAATNHRLLAVDVGVNRHVAKATELALTEVMAKDAQRRRRGALFRRTATLLLLAHAIGPRGTVPRESASNASVGVTCPPPRSSTGSAPSMEPRTEGAESAHDGGAPDRAASDGVGELARLPLAVMLLIMELAAPDGFDVAAIKSAPPTRPAYQLPEVS